MPVINPYLNFNGNTEEAFLFYKTVFGGEFITFQRFKDVPDLPGAEMMSPSDLNQIMHVALPIGDGNVLMATDVLESFGHPKVSGNNISISVGADSAEEAHQIFNALSLGGKAEMPLEEAFWGALFGMLTDRFGIQWMVNYQHD